MTVRLLDVRVWNHAEQPGHSVYVRGPFPRRIWRCARHDCDWSHHETTGVTVGDQEAPTEPPSKWNPEGITMDEAGNLIYPQPAPEPERCPTCGETAEWDWIAAPCPDPWHSSDLEAEER